MQHVDRYERLQCQQTLKAGTPGVALIEYEDGERELVDLKVEKFRGHRDAESDDERDDDTVDGDDDDNNFNLVVEGEWIEILWPTAHMYFLSYTPIKSKKKSKKRRARKKGEVVEDTKGESAEEDNMDSENIPPSVPNVEAEDMDDRGTGGADDDVKAEEEAVLICGVCAGVHNPEYDNSYCIRCDGCKNWFQTNNICMGCNEEDAEKLPGWKCFNCKFSGVSDVVDYYKTLIQNENDDSKKIAMFCTAMEVSSLFLDRDHAPTEEETRSAFSLLKITLMTRKDYKKGKKKKGSCKLAVDKLLEALEQVHPQKTVFFRIMLMLCPKKLKGGGQFNGEDVDSLPDGKERGDCNTLRMLDLLGRYMLKDESIDYKNGWPFLVINMRSLCEQTKDGNYVHCKKGTDNEAVQR